ncbi:hypothetical protein JAAARDRAFT_41132 [Jaapia argillacea MUCL 33604]|uniref:C2 domain-containing protein n=1 Tax=Jaapia argillacea MUCL 33604 TaxID=933084 RepID=A0A067PCF1_9AGAM|nr:hypothetical protein JAAARDRAFT_41132 [Jaapia argillacea MUCL 33604]
MNQTTTKPNLDQPVGQRPADENATITLELTILGAQDLHKHRKQVPNCFVQITGGGGEALSTRTVEGANPRWNETFTMTTSTSSMLHIEVSHRRRFGGNAFRGAATIPVQGLAGQPGGTETTHDLVKEGGTGYGKIMVVSRITTSAATEQGGKVPLEQDLQVITSEANKAQNAIAMVDGPSGIDVIGTAIDHVDGITGNDLLQTVGGYLETVVRIGDVISKVHPYAKLAWQVLTSGYKVIYPQGPG